MSGIKIVWLACTVALLVACGDDRGKQIETPAGESLPWMSCSVQANGAFVLDFGFANNRKLLARGTLGAENSAEQDAARLQLRKAMGALLQDETYWQPDGVAAITLRVAGAPGAPWRYAQWILQAGYHPEVKITRLEMRLSGETEGTRLDLPSGGKSYIYANRSYYAERVEDEGEGPTIKLVRARHPDTGRAFTRIEIGDKRLELPDGGRLGQASYEASMDAFGRALAAVLEKSPTGMIEISMPPPLGYTTPYGDVLQLVRTLVEHGRRYFVFSDAGMPFRVR